MKQRRFLSVLLALCLVLGMCPGTVFAAGGRLPFTDVKTADWYYDAVQYVYVEGMMNGTGAATFSPNSTTSRGMIVTILHRLDGTPSATGAAFTDVPAGQWYTDAVAWASANEIVGGYGNGKFGPDDPITREQMATILYRYSRYKGYDTTVSGSLSGFPDAAKTSSYAADAMRWAVGTGLIAGMDDGTLAPQGSATRAQAATIFMRYCENVIPEREPEPDDKPASETYTVTFAYNYGSQGTYKTLTVTAGETVASPDDPSRSGYTFDGWYTSASGGSKFDFDTVITGNLALYAHWNVQNNSGGNPIHSNSGSSNPPETTAVGKISYKAPTESDIDLGIIEYEGQTYTAKYVNNQLIAVFKTSVNRNEVEKLIEAYGASIVGEIETIGMYQIEFNSAKTMTELNSILNELKEVDIVEDVYLNSVVECEDTLTPYYPNDTWDIDTDAEPAWNELFPSGNNWGAEAINAPSAWSLLIDKYGTISQIPSVRIGIIDGYIDMTHDDLDVSAVYWYQNGFNIFKKNQTATTAADYAAAADNGEDFGHIIHGTHVLGTIGATINNGGINGIALNPELYGVSVAETSFSVVYTRFGLSTALSNLIEDSNCQVINYSMGYADYNPTKAMDDGEKVGKVLKKYLDKNYDFLIVASAGNESSRDAQYNSIFSGISDATVKSHIIIVGNAMNDNDGTVSLYPNQHYGARVDVIAPGTDIYSTVPPNENSLSGGGVHYTANSKYMLATGTSMAAPHVSGVAALVWAANPTLTGERVKNIIIETANIIVDRKDAGGYTHSMVNAAYAVSKALGVEYTVNGTCGSNMTWTLDTAGNLTIQGTGEMSWESEYAPWYRYYEVIRNIKIGDGITTIYTEAFLDCFKVKTIELGNDVKSIGDNAFGGMTNLKEVTLPNTLKYIGDGTFCFTALTSITIPKSVTKIGTHSIGYADVNDETAIDDFIIYGYSNSAAETYAKQNNIKFVSLDLEPTITPAISGTVKDADTGKPVEGVTVYLMCIFGAGGEDLAARCETAADGTFKMDIPQGEGITGVSSIEFQKDGYNSYRLSLDSSTNFSLGTINLMPIDSSINSSLYTFELEENIDKRTFTTTSLGSQVVALTYQISTDIPDFDASNVQWTTTSTVTDLQTDGQNAVVTTNTGFTITASYTYNGYTYTCDHKVSSLVIRALLNSVQW